MSSCFLAKERAYKVERMHKALKPMKPGFRGTFDYD